MKKNAIGLVLACGILVSGIAIFDVNLIAPAQAAHELEARNILRGKELYDENCASCHGANLAGQKNWQSKGADGIAPAPPHDETGHTWHHDNQLLFDYTKLGGQKLLAARGVENYNSGMPGFVGLLEDDDIWDILGYIHSTWPKRVQDIQAARNQPHK
ncbi:MAG: cytochrome c [Cognatishimia sp.]|uniref:c-type cytochrome n=1 Tax=Cognatishimia sp. TaxID=2211648 RepID=UPI003B8B5CED